MSQQELLANVVEILGAAGIEYMVTGSAASSLQGEPRLSHDIDLVVALEEEQAKALLNAFPPPQYYLSEDAMDAAIVNRQMFNLIDVTGGDKVDFWLLGEGPFDRSRFARRRLVESGGLAVYVSSPEDTILAKLRWAKLCGGSEKQFADALRVYEVQLPTLDFDYLNDWVKRLDLQELWTRLERQASPPDFPN